MNGINVIVSNAPRKAVTGKCQSIEGCTHKVERDLYGVHLCLNHYYRAYRELEMNNGGEAA